MTPLPPHGTPAGDAILAIRQLARQTGQDVQDLLSAYALEGLLTRLAVSEFRNDFVLKGGALMAAFSLRRPTKDIDLQATGLDNEPNAVAERIRQIAATNVTDGLEFDLGTVKTTVIREEGEYAGIRVTLQAGLSTARLKIGIDVNFGDPIWPEPVLVTIPRVVETGLAAATVLGYPITMVLSEKIVTAIRRGEANTRWRDFGDVNAIARTHQVMADDLLAAMRTTANHRKSLLAPLLPSLANMPTKAQAKWVAWRSRTGRTDLPERFSDVLNEVAHFADPVIKGEVADQTWNPDSRRWE